ncbi:hypothetical protein DFH29DRAFT_1014945 [Suillus ampliporus]|nr:hypothetical protein DFH29DRAFT_1014945 [Suillus ampliporus]
MSVTYGHEKVSWDASPIKSVTELLTIGLPPERSAILTAFPILTRLPAWFPGATFQCARKLALESMDAPFEYVKRNVAAGSTPKSIMSDLLSQRDKGKEAFAERAVEEIALTVFVGLPHATSSDDVSEGYFIPKDSLIIPNVWDMSREGRDDPDVFRSEIHFASDGTLSPDTISTKPVWGFGRRGRGASLFPESFFSQPD